FNGRESELAIIIQQIVQGSARIAILGAGGMGKTSLAKAVLHDTDIAAKHKSCFFVACDSATTSVELAALIGAQIGLQPRNNLTELVVQSLSQTPSLLILDNLETAWEPPQSQVGVEEFLSLITDIKDLTLIITMRGAERPARVRWTRPFLPPLNPLSDAAAYQTFIDIADSVHDSKDVDRLLCLTDNMPLIITLIARLADFEGCRNVLARWEIERTSLLSDSDDPRWNLAASISISLSSPRITYLPGAKDLLSLLSILPDGISDMDLIQCNLPLKNVLRCESVLLSTSLAYSDDQRRLRMLAPIREHMQDFHPPSPILVDTVYQHFSALVNLYAKYHGSMSSSTIVNNITPNL
ncbi:hypothetical protein C8R44DRAFT_542214, partial [Mycena epipterygia]